MIKSIEKINYIDHRIEYLTNYIKELEKYKLKCDIERQKEVIKIYESIKYDLEVFEIIKKYIRFEENYKSVEGQSLSFNYDRIILKALNNFDLIGLPLPQVKEKIKDFVIVKNYILTNKVGDSND